MGHSNTQLDSVISDLDLCDTSAMTDIVVPTNSPKAHVHFPALLSATYVTAYTSHINVTASHISFNLPVICSNIIFQEVGYFENLTLSSSLRNEPSSFSGSYINSRAGKWQMWR